MGENLIQVMLFRRLFFGSWGTRRGSSAKDKAIDSTGQGLEEVIVLPRKTMWTEERLFLCIFAFVSDVR